MSSDPQWFRRAYRQMLRIRLVEEHMESLYHLDEMKTPIHLCIGQEAIAVGVCDVLTHEDCIQSNHRSHGHYLAKGGDLKAMVAELYCRETGCARGRGGSMHLIDLEVGHVGSSSIVGGGIPLGTGQALAIQMQQAPQVVAVFLGDGAADEGVLYESLNFAILRKLPVIYVLEDNGWAVCSRVDRRQAMDNIFLYAPPERLATARIDGNDVEAVHAAAESAVTRARAGEGPTLIHAKTYRVRGHAGSYSDARLGYRTQEEIDDWCGRCPVERARQRLLESRAATETHLAEMTREIEEEIREAFAYARRSPLPSRDGLLKYLYQDPQ